MKRKPRQKVYDLYWYFAAERQNIFFRKLAGQKPPFTEDPILQTYKFCNAYRAADRVSQFLIRSVIYSKEYSSEDLLLRILLFRLLNKIETWKRLEEKIGPITLNRFNSRRYSRALDEIKKYQPIYGNAFILCANKAFGHEKKHDNQLALLDYVFKSKANKILGSKTLEELFLRLKELPLIGDFMAYQLAIDLNYSELFNFSENDFTIAGPGAERGILKCFDDAKPNDFSSIIMHMVENQENEFEGLGLEFKSLWGRPLHAVDCQNLFCELDKYCRVKLPELKSSRKKIKTIYKQNESKINYFFPPKWDINKKIK